MSEFFLETYRCDHCLADVDKEDLTDEGNICKDCAEILRKRDIHGNAVKRDPEARIESFRAEKKSYETTRNGERDIKPASYCKWPWGEYVK